MKNYYEEVKEKIIISVICVIILIGLIVVINGTSESTEREEIKALEAILTEYEKEFNEETETEGRIEIAEEVDRLYKGVDAGELTEKNEDFLEACRMITKYMGSTEEK